MKRSFNLGDRLISFAVAMIKLAERLPKTQAGIYLTGQLTRSGTSPALHYGEAQSAESRSDFIHKMKVAAKELRETNNCLKIMNKMYWFEKDSLSLEQSKCNELISIFVKSIATTQKNKE